MMKNRIVYSLKSHTVNINNNNSTCADLRTQPLDVRYEAYRGLRSHSLTQPRQISSNEPHQGIAESSAITAPSKRYSLINDLSLT